MTTEEVVYDEVGRVKGEWYFDPIDLPALNERAAICGRDRQHLIQDFCSEVWKKGWIWEFTPKDEVSIRLTLEQRRKLEEILDVKALTGDDLYNFITGLAESPIKFGS